MLAVASVVPTRLAAAVTVLLLSTLAVVLVASGTSGGVTRPVAGPVADDLCGLHCP